MIIGSQTSLQGMTVNKCDSVETSLLNTDSMNGSEGGSIFEENRHDSGYTKKFSLARQNKDGANAARTARITLVAMLLSENRKDVMEVLRKLREDVHIKKLMLNIGER